MIDDSLNARIVAVAAAIDERRRHGQDALERPIVAYASLLLAYDPSRIAADDVRGLLDGFARSIGSAAGHDDGPVIEIPVRYGGEGGPDLDEVADRLGLSPEAVVAGHTGTTYRVFMLGFAPGFAYLGTLSPELSLPRRSEPRVSVPAGSVAIAARQTGVYPVASPGGWHLIGRTQTGAVGRRVRPPGSSRTR